MPNRLRNYIIRRILTIFPTLFAVSVLTFVIIHLAPGGPFQMFIGMNPSVPPEVIEKLKESYGLNDPLYVQYFRWIKLMLQGDMGYSFISGKPVTAKIGSRVWNTLLLMVTAQTIAILLAIPLSVISAVKQGKPTDNIIRVFSLLGMSMPIFWFGIMMIFAFSLGVGFFPALFPTSGIQYLPPPHTLLGKIGGRLIHLILPAIVLSLTRVAYLTRLTRSSILDVLQEDYVMTARMKGLKERVILYKHVLRNALLPTVTAIGLSVGFLMSGAVITESVFGWPGMGRLLVDAVFSRDYPTIMGITMIIATLVVVANMLTDIVYGFLDPRVRY